MYHLTLLGWLSMCMFSLVVEDVETSYWSEQAKFYNYSYRGQHSFVERMKLVADAVNREFSLGESPLPTLYNTVSTLMFGQNIIILRHGSEISELLHNPYLFRQNICKQTCFCWFLNILIGNKRKMRRQNILTGLTAWLEWPRTLWRNTAKFNYTLI